MGMRHRVTRSTVELHLDELVLHEFSAADVDGLGDAIASELTRVIGQNPSASVALQTQTPRAVAAAITNAVEPLVRR